MMKLTLKHLLVVSVILTLFLGLNLVSATNITDDSALSTKNICTHSITSDSNIDVNDINNYVKNTVTSTSANDSNSDENIKEENNGNTGGASNGGTIAELNETINGGSSSNITLDKDYTYNNGTLSIINVTNDITITKENSSTSYAANTILSLVDGYSNSSTNIINLGTGTGNCTKTLAYDGTADNNLRYIGTNPCNYVSFNGQEWRIIGVFNNVSVVGENEPQTLLKLITATDYSSTILWDSGNKNIWGSSSLYTTLNGTYYTTNLNSSSYIANVMWSLGASPNSSISASQFYAAEHGTVVPSGATSQYAGYVGIMHASDYGFATSGDMDNSTRGDCISAALNASKDWTSSCYNYDWLSYATTMWTINPRSGVTNHAYRVSYNILNYTTVGGTYSKATVRPVIFLKSNVKIDSGDGSSGSGAYQLSQ